MERTPGESIKVIDEEISIFEVAEQKQVEQDTGGQEGHRQRGSCLGPELLQPNSYKIID